MSTDGNGPRSAHQFLKLASDPLRWQLLRELGRSDRQVRELVERLGQPQNLVSYHLGRLKDAGLVAMRRSSADRRDAYYSVDFPACSQRLAAVGAALNPGLMPAAQTAHPVRLRRRPRVLFLCTGNSARSQMAEALMTHLAAGRIEACSAGSHPKALHPDAVRVMAQRGVDISDRRTRHLREFSRRRFDKVVSLCDRVREVCPEFPGNPETVHWSMPDPSAAGTTAAERYAAFERTAAELEWRVRYLIARIEHPATESIP